MKRTRNRKRPSTRRAAGIVEAIVAVMEDPTRDGMGRVLAARMILGLADGTAVISYDRRETRARRALWRRLDEWGTLGEWNRFEDDVRAHAGRCGVAPEETLLEFYAHLQGMPATTVVVALDWNVHEMCGALATLAAAKVRSERVH